MFESTGRWVIVAGAGESQSVRDEMRRAWQAAAPSWDKHRQIIASPTRPITEQLIEAARIEPGDRVLDLACGVGDPAFSISACVGPKGSVLALDLTAAMLDAARSFARSHEIDNVEFRHVDTELDLGVEPATFDAATCRFGLMFMPDPVAALKEILRALKPDAWLAVSTWAPERDSPGFSVPTQVIRKYVDVPSPPAGAPGQFALSSPEQLQGMFGAAGFTDVDVGAVVVPIEVADTPEEFWDNRLEISARLRDMLAGVSEDVRQAIRREVAAELTVLCPSGPVGPPVTALVTAGRKPA